MREEQRRLRDAEATLKDYKVSAPLILIPGIGIIGITLIVGSIVWAIIEARKRKKPH